MVYTSSRTGVRLNHFKHAFSLVELSIVLVILGLLVGGVLSGQSLIRASELRSVTAEFEKYATAVYSFRDKYFGLPGDITNATAIWGDAGSTDCTTAVGQVFVAGTCNGDGDGKINPNSPGANMSGEAFRAWQQLALAGLIEGKYTGKAGLNSNNYVVGVDAPKSRIANSAGWNLTNSDFTNIVSANAFQYDYTNAMQVGAPCVGFGCSNMDGVIIKGAEAWNIDTKIDDGMPGRGKVNVTIWIDTCSNATSSSDYNTTYRFNDTYGCALYFRYLN